MYTTSTVHFYVGYGNGHFNGHLFSSTDNCQPRQTSTHVYTELTGLTVKHITSLSNNNALYTGVCLKWYSTVRSVPQHVEHERIACNTKSRFRPEPSLRTYGTV